MKHNPNSKTITERVEKLEDNTVKLKSLVNLIIEKLDKRG